MEFFEPMKMIVFVFIPLWMSNRSMDASIRSDPLVQLRLNQLRQQTLSIRKQSSLSRDHLFLFSVTGVVGDLLDLTPTEDALTRGNDVISIARKRMAHSPGLWCRIHSRCGRKVKVHVCNVDRRVAVREGKPMLDVYQAVSFMAILCFKLVLHLDRMCSFIVEKVNDLSLLVAGK
jgi:hypothetical protein